MPALFGRKVVLGASYFGCLRWFCVIFIPMFLIFYSISPVLSTWSDKFCSTIAKAEPIGINLCIFFPFSHIIPIFEPLEGAVDSTFQICCECNQLSHLFL